MAVYDGHEHQYRQQETHDEISELDSYRAGKNHESLLLCGPDNDTQWLMSDLHVDIAEER